jgi:hypothetical protein
MTVRIATLVGAAIHLALDALSALRLAVFRDWPYLYDGDAVYEADYLGTFTQSPDAIVVCAYDDDTMVGAATAAPLAGHTDEFVPSFEAHRCRPAEVFYCG